MPQFNLFRSSEQPVGKTPACPTAAEQWRELVRQVATGSYSVARSARNSLLHLSNRKRLPQRAERRRDRGDARSSSTYFAFVLRFFFAAPGAAAFLPSKFAISLLATTPVTTRALRAAAKYSSRL
jgi:hypothetical protein